jgi:hypothetical protein
MSLKAHDRSISPSARNESLSNKSDHIPDIFENHQSIFSSAAQAYERLLLLKLVEVKYCIVSSDEKALLTL